MQRKQQVGECWVCVLFFAFVCVGASDSTTVYGDPNFLRSLCRVRWVLPRGVPRGLGMSPLVTHNVRGNAPNFCFWAVFDIFSGFLN
jgi:hypothetical protein